MWINNLRNDTMLYNNNNNHPVEVIIVSFLKIVNPLKYPSNACLSYVYLDNGLDVTPCL